MQFIGHPPVRQDSWAGRFCYHEGGEGELNNFMAVVACGVVWVLWKRRGPAPPPPRMTNADLPASHEVGKACPPFGARQVHRHTDRY